MALSKRDLNCPECGAVRHFKNHVGLLLYEFVGNKKYYDYYCPKCNKYGQVEKNNGTRIRH